MKPALLLILFLLPASSWAWTLTDRCELARETPKGTVAVARIPKGILLYPPDGLIANDARVKVGIGGRIWRARVVGGGIELQGGVGPFLEKNWATVHVDGDHALGFSLSGSSGAWEKLQDCERVQGRGGWVVLRGEIGASSDDEIISAIRRRQPEGVLLDSAGGLAEEAQRIGDAVRKAGMATKVEAAGQCLSECTFILAAGTPRTVEAGGRVGVTPSLITGGLGVFGGDQTTVTDSAVYFKRMGVNGGKLAVLATLPGGDAEVRTFTPAELRELELVDTSTPTAAVSAIPERLSELDGGSWWLLGGLLGLGALWWGLTRIWDRA
jgi:hypothetical protein